MLKCLLVFDDSLDIEKIDCIFLDQWEQVDLCSLSANFLLLNSLKEKLVARGLRVDVINMAGLLADEVKRSRSRLIEWSALLGNFKVKNGKRLIDVFKLPRNQVSSWWFGLLSEKNPFKTDAFHQIFVVHTLQGILSEKAYHHCLICVSPHEMGYAIENAVRAENVSVTYFSPGRRIIKEKMPWRRLRGVLQGKGVAGMFLLGFIAWLEMMWRAACARFIMGRRTKRVGETSPLLFVSYFPAVDHKQLKDNRFKNRYTASLQDKLAEIDEVVTWIMICADIDGYSYKQAVCLARQFQDGGEKIFVLEEFLTLKDVIIILFMWLRQAAAAAILFSQLDKSIYQGFVGPEFKLVFKRLWHTSFCGELAVEGIVYYYIFRNIFNELKNLKKCVYICEMHAWEKALNAAKLNSSLRVKTIGFQHAAVSKNYFNYFYHKSETKSSHDKLRLPLPDLLACNGDLSRALFAAADYPEARVVEAIRHMYLKDILSVPITNRPTRPILLVAGSIDQKESTALISLVHGAYPHADDIDIWFKGHPVMPFEGLFEKEKIDKTKTGYFICHDNIADCLKKAWAVLVPTSTVAIEALAFGCEVIVPVFPNSILMNPLADYELFYQRVTTPEELKDVLDKLAARGFLADMEARRAFIEDYFFLNPGLSRWQNLLTSPNG